MSKHKPKVLIYDIETSPNLSYTWGKWQQDVIDFEKEWYMLCFAYKWLGEKKIRVHSLPDYATYKKDKENDFELVKELWNLFEEADIIIAHNGDKFDIKKSNAKFLEHGFRPPSNYKTVDTLKVARKHFNLNSNRLDDIGRLLKIGRKVPTTGFHLWKGCMTGDKTSWGQMVKYNKQDVNLLEQVYLELRPWMTNHPNMNLLQGTAHSCPTCGSGNCQKRGFRRTRSNTYQAYQCQDCGGWSQGEIIKSDERVIR